jgi:hypothetical protein
MVGRERSYTSSRSGGQTGAFTWQYPGGPYGEPSEQPRVLVSSSFCGDQIHDGDNRPFITDRWRNEGGVISKPFDGYWSSWFYDYPADIQRGSHESHLGTDSPGDNYVATKAVAACNPSKPFIDFPVALAEEYQDSVLKLRDVGGSQIAQLANGNLHYQFGVAQAGRDLGNLALLSREIDRRIKVIERLKTRGYRCTSQQGTYQAFATEGRYVQSANELMYADFQIESTERVWAHTRWALTESSISSMQSPAEVRGFAARSAMGLTIDSSTAWNLVPWTHIADWFGSVGSYLSGTRNIIPATLIEVTVMRHAMTLATCGDISYKNIYGIPVHMTGIARTRERKSRAYSYPTPFAAYIPGLTGRQVGIVASLLGAGYKGRGARGI